MTPENEYQEKVPYLDAKMIEKAIANRHKSVLPELEDILKDHPELLARIAQLEAKAVAHDTTLLVIEQNEIPLREIAIERKDLDISKNEIYQKQIEINLLERLGATIKRMTE